MQTLSDVAWLWQSRYPRCEQLQFRNNSSLTYPAPVIAEVEDARDAAPQGFQVRLSEFEGPFDLLLHLISKHKLEVTELALHVVTDEFIAYIKDQGADWDLDEATEFLVIAATLLDLK
ncbi:MAG: hypothetical protein RIS43_9, partial [Actinomycetota bacterium]